MKTFYSTLYIMTQRATLLLSLFVFSHCGSVTATNYYVDSAKGSDSNNGKSPAKAWRTLANVNSGRFEPGDSVFFRRGCIWRETLSLSSSGNSSKDIVYSNYGRGPKPAFLGSSEVKSWISQGPNLWKSKEQIKLDPYAGYFKAEIFFISRGKNVRWGKHKSALSELTADLDWTWSDGYVFIYSASDPGKTFTQVEVPQRQQCIDLKNRTGIRIDGLDLYFARWSGISYDWSKDMADLSGLKVFNSQIAWIGSASLLSGYGTEMAYSDMIISGDTIHDCGRRSISLDIYGSGFTVRNVLIEKCVFYSGFHTTGIDLSVGNKNYNAGYNGVVIRRNLFYDDPASDGWANQIFLQNYDYAGGGARVENVLIYSNIFRYPSSVSIMAEGIQGCGIYNNTFYNHNTTKGKSVCHIWIDAHNTGIKIKNNIFYTTLGNDNLGNGIAITLLSDVSDVEADYNLYYRINKFLKIINYRTTFSSDELAGIRKLMKWEINSPSPSDPLFNNPAVNDFSLKKGSPCAGTGVRLPEVECDFFGNRFSQTPSIGAVEYAPHITRQQSK